MTPTPLPTIPQPTWRSTVVGVLMLAFIAGRAVVDRQSLFSADTGAILAVACGLILGSDKLLGH
jgi:hypothetical protein